MTTPPTSRLDVLRRAVALADELWALEEGKGLLIDPDFILALALVHSDLIDALAEHERNLQCEWSAAH